MMADDLSKGDSTDVAAVAAAIRIKGPNRDAEFFYATRWGPDKAVRGIPPAEDEAEDIVGCASSGASPVSDHIHASNPARPLPCSTSLNSRKNSRMSHSCQQRILSTVRLRMSSSEQHFAYLRKSHSAAPSARYHKRIDYEDINSWGYAEWPPFSRPSLSQCGNLHSKRWAPDASHATNTKQTPSNKAFQEQKVLPRARECATPACNLNSTSLKFQRQRLNQRMFFCLLTVAAFLCSLLCWFLLRQKQGNPLTQAMMLYATHKEMTVQQIRRMIKVYNAELVSLASAPLLGKLLQVVTSWFSNSPTGARLTSWRAVSSSGRPETFGQRVTAVESGFGGAKGADVERIDSYLPGASMPQRRETADLEFGNGPGTLLQGGNHEISVHPVPPLTGPYLDGDRVLHMTAEEEGAFLDSLTMGELRDLILAEGGWTYIPHTRHNLPLELPDTLPALPRAGGGRFLRRHHAADSPPLFPGKIPGISAEQVLRNGRQLLTAEAYREAASVLQHAVRDGHLTRAVRLHGQFLYPWKLFSDEEREALRLLADQVRWFPKWVKNHRRSQRVDKSVLDLYLPVVVPQFTDHYGGPGSPSMNLSQGIRFTWLGHAAGLVNIDGLQVLLDPMFDHDLIGSYNEWLRSLVLYVNALCGSLGGRHREPPCSYENMPADIDIVILSHNHQDHIMENDVKTLCDRLSDRFKKLIWYVPEGVSTFLRQYGCASPNIFEFSWGETRTLSCHTRSRRRICIDGVWKKQRALVETYEVTFAAGLHWSGRTASKTDHNASLWGGYAINGPRHKFFYGGDTAYWRADFDEFRKIGNILGPFHLAALPIGAYEPNEDLRYQHVKPHETLKMFKDLKAEIAVGVHWGTLRLSAEDFFDPMLDLECALLGLAEEDCHRTSALRQRYKATEAYLRYYRSRQAKYSNNPSQTPLPSPTPRKDNGPGTQLGGEPSSLSSKKGKPKEKSRRIGAADSDQANEERSSLPEQRASPCAGRKNIARTGRRSMASKRSKTPPPKRSKTSSPNSNDNNEFEELLRHLQTLMLPMADCVSNASNFQRLLRALKLQDAGILPNTRTWKDNLLKEGARFQTLFVGQSIQVESSENNDFIWMTRSSGLQHILTNAPEEHYTFNPMYTGDEVVSPLDMKPIAEGLLSPQQLPPPAVSPDSSQDDYLALLT